MDQRNYTGHTLNEYVSHVENHLRQNCPTKIEESIKLGHHRFFLTQAWSENWSVNDAVLYMTLNSKDSQEEWSLEQLKKLLDKYS